MEIGFPSFCALFALLFLVKGIESSIGVNYGMVADDLPPPAEVARFVARSTVINRVRLFDANPEILQSFAHTGVAITITIPNDQIPRLVSLNHSKEWIELNVKPYWPATKIIRIMVGNEVLSTANKFLIASLVPAMQALHTALEEVSLDDDIKVSTPHSLSILTTSNPPSTGRFRQGYDASVLKPLLEFLQSTNSPFMINPYPFFGCSSDTLDYALFRPNAGVIDENTGLNYTNMLDGQLDAVYSAMKLIGFADVDIVIAETGWPSKGDASQVGVDAESAAQYNQNLMKHVVSGDGTPLMPGRIFETYIFALFNEDLKPGPPCERNFGLFYSNMTPSYDIGIVKPTAVSNPMPRVSEPIKSQPDVSSSEKNWCVPRESADADGLQRNIDYVCGLGIDCTQISVGGDCFLPDTVRSHASFAMNKYYQISGRNDYNCDFRLTGVITNVDPSYGNCKY